MSTSLSVKMTLVLRVLADFYAFLTIASSKQVIYPVFYIVRRKRP